VSVWRFGEGVCRNPSAALRVQLIAHRVAAVDTTKKRPVVLFEGWCGEGGELAKTKTGRTHECDRDGGTRGRVR